MPGIDEYLNLVKKAYDKAKESGGDLGSLFEFQDMKPKRSPVKEKKEEKPEPPKDKIRTDMKSNETILSEIKNEEYRQREFDTNSVIPLEFTKEAMMQGMIYGEILGKPLCKRRRR